MTKFSVVKVKSKDMIGDLGEHNFQGTPKIGETITINGLRYEVKSVVPGGLIKGSKGSGTIFAEDIE